MDLAAEFGQLIGRDKVKSGAELTTLDPGLHAANLKADVAVFPQSTDDVVKLLRFCTAKRISVVPQGGRTGLAGGAASEQGQLVLSLQRMNRISRIDPQASLAVVEAGVTLQVLDEALAVHGLCAGIDLGARGSATVGGMISTNAGGIEAFRNGVMRSRVMGLEAVLADGTIITDLAEVAKCNEGYDVKQLFIGAEGTLGVVTRAVIGAVRRPSRRTTALISTVSAAGAVQLFRRLEGRGLLAFEMMTGRYLSLLIEAHGVHALGSFAQQPFSFIVEIEASEGELIEALGGAEITDAIIAKSEAERLQFWKLREDSFAADRAYPGALWYDLSVPLSCIDQYLQELDARVTKVAPGAVVFAIGHLGDGNLHLTVGAPQPLAQLAEAVTYEVYRDLKEMGGSFSAEHGIGLEKRASLAKLVHPGKLAMMRAIKAALDPLGILNPGKVLESTRTSR